MQTGGRTFARILMRALKILTLLALEQSAGIVWACRLAMAGVDSAGHVSDRPLPASPYPAPTGKGAPPRLSILIGGYELVLCAAVSFVIECGLFLWLCLGADRGSPCPV